MPFPTSLARALPAPPCAWGGSESGTTSVGDGDRDGAAPCLVNHPPCSSGRHLGAYQTVHLYLEAPIALAGSQRSTRFSWWRVCGGERERSKVRGGCMQTSGTQHALPPQSSEPPPRHLLGPFHVEDQVVIAESGDPGNSSGCILPAVEADEGKTLGWEESERVRRSRGGGGVSLSPPPKGGNPSIPTLDCPVVLSLAK